MTIKNNIKAIVQYYINTKCWKILKAQNVQNYIIITGVGNFVKITNRSCKAQKCSNSKIKELKEPSLQYYIFIISIY